MYPLRITGELNVDDLETEPAGIRLADLCARHGLASQAEILRHMCASPEIVGGVVSTSGTDPVVRTPREFEDTQLMPTIAA